MSKLQNFYLPEKEGNRGGRSQEQKKLIHSNLMNIGGNVWQQSLMSGTFQKVSPISFLIYYLDVSVSGYLLEVPPKWGLQNDDTLHQGVCSSPEKHQLFNDIINDSSHSGIEIKCFCSGDNNNDIIVNDFSSANEIELNFERKTSQSKPFTFEQVINEYAIYDIVDVTGLVYNL